jgi:hypothetical protein
MRLPSVEDDTSTASIEQCAGHYFFDWNLDFGDVGFVIAAGASADWRVKRLVGARLGQFWKYSGHSSPGHTKSLTPKPSKFSRLILKTGTMTGPHALPRGLERNATEVGKFTARRVL